MNTPNSSGLGAPTSGIGTRGLAGGGWGSQVLNILFTVFIIAIIFGVMLIATTTSNSTITNIQANLANLSSSFAQTQVKSTAAVDQNSLNGNVLVYNVIGTNTNVAAYPVTFNVFGNVVTTFATNNAFAISGATNTFTYTVSANAGTLNTVATFYNAILVTALNPQNYQWQPFANVLVQQYYVGIVHNVATLTFQANSISASTNDVVTVGTENIGTTGQSAVGVFGTLAGYIVTLSNFVGIIILLAIIVVVIGVLYFFFGRKEASSSGLRGGL